MGEARNDFDIFRDLARRLRCEHAFAEGRDETAWLRHLYGAFRERAQSNLIPEFDTFWKKGWVEIPLRAEEYVLFAEFRADPDKHKLRTPSGRIELYSDEIAGFHYHDCPPHPAWIEPAEWLGGGSAAHFPLHLVSSQPQYKLHSQMDAGPVSARGKTAGRETLAIHPADARERGIGDGEVVRVFNDRGACFAGVVVTDAVRPGVVRLSCGAWYDPASDADDAPCAHDNANVLTRDRGTSSLQTRAIPFDERTVEFWPSDASGRLYRTAVGASLASASLYHSEFFDRQRGGSRRSAVIAVPLLIDLFEPQSVLDVGCGTGVWLSVFQEHGVEDILGIDGPWIEQRQREIPDAVFRECDLTQPVALERTFDLALCLEVAEHLPPEAAPGLVQSLTALAPVVVFSAAIPGQGGEGHINERWPSFWSRYFAAHGYVSFAGLRHRLWPADAVEFWYRQNMLCFVAEARRDLVKRASRKNEGSATGPLDVVHPQLYLQVSSELERRRRDVDKLEREIQETRAELRAIKSSKPWRFYQSIRRMVVGATRVSSR